MSVNEFRVTRERVANDGATSVRTTTYETKQSYDSDNTTYKPRVTPRQVVIQRSTTPVFGVPAMSRGFAIERSMGFGLTPEAIVSVAATGVDTMKRTREKERRDMQDLNERFAGYIEKVRFLEAQNRRLADELEKLKSKWGKETTQVKAMYQAELEEARHLLDEAEKEKAGYQIKVVSLEDLVNELNKQLSDANRLIGDQREKIDSQNRQLVDFEAEISLQRKRIEGFEGDRERDKSTISRLQEAVNRMRLDLDSETLLHIDAENRRKTLEEELEFLKQIHEQEMRELANLAYRDTTPENREFWKNEMGQALREIQKVYDEKLDAIRGEMDSFYNLKIREFTTGATRQNMESAHAKEESQRLRTQLTEQREKLNDLETKNSLLQRELESLRRDKDERERELQYEITSLQTEVTRLKAELDAILKELQDIMDSKLGLELEIAAYRKLLEGEESRDGLRQVVDSWLTNQSGSRTGPVSSSAFNDSALKVSQVVKGEMSAKTTSKKSYKGIVSIADCSPDGKYICLENVGRREQVLDNWKVVRNVDGKEFAAFTFERSFVLKTASNVKIWARGTKPFNAPMTDLETSFPSWGTGSNVITLMFDPAGVEQASHHQTTTYSS